MLCDLSQSKWTLCAPKMDRQPETEHASVGIHRSSERLGVKSHRSVSPEQLAIHDAGANVLGRCFVSSW